MRLTALVPIAVLLATACNSETGLNASPQGAGWIPGDPVPGWDDFDCTVEGGNLLTELLSDSIDTRQAVYTDGYIGPDGIAVPGLLLLYATDCTTYSCSGYDGPPVSGYGQFIPAPHTGHQRYQGWYPNRATFDDPVDGILDSAFAASPFGWLGYDPYGGYYRTPDPPLRGCVERNRPDQIIAYVDWVVPLDGDDSSDPSDDADWQYDYPLIFRVKFDVKNTGVCSDSGGWTFIGWTDDYEAAWPWDDITDPAVRDALHDRYLPCEWM